MQSDLDQINVLFNGTKQEFNEISKSILKEINQKDDSSLLIMLSKKFLKEKLSISRQRIIDLFNAVPRKLYEIALQMLTIQEKMNITNLYEESINIFLIKGLLLLLNRQLSDSEHALNLALQKDPENSMALFLLANSLRLQHQYKQAKTILEKLIQNDPSNAIYWHRIGLIEMDQYHFKIARQYFQKAFSLNSSEVYALLQQVWLDIEENNLEIAKDSLENCIKIDPYDPFIYTTYGDLESLQNNYNSALLYYQRAVDLNPNYIHLWKNLAITYIEIENFSAAEFSIQKMIELDPHRVEGWLAWAWFYQSKNENTKAIESIYQGLKSNPNSGELYLELAKCFNIIEDAKHELWTLKQAYRHDSLNNLVQNALGYYYLMHEEYENAKLCFLESYKIDPENIQCLNGLGSTLYKINGNFKEAEKFYQKSIQINPNYFITWIELGQLYFQEALYIKSEECLLKANEISPNEPNTLHFLGLIAWNEHHDLKSAEQIFLKILSIDNDNIATAADLAELYLYEYNDPKKARDILQPYYEKHQTDEYLITLMEEIKSFSSNKSNFGP